MHRSSPFADIELTDKKYVKTSTNDKDDKELSVDEIKERLGKDIYVISQDDVNNNFDIVLNGTPCGMYPNEINLPIPFDKIKKVPFIFDTI